MGNANPLPRSYLRRILRATLISGIQTLALLSTLVIISYIQPSSGFAYRLSNTASSPWNRFAGGPAYRIPNRIEMQDKRNFFPLFLSGGRDGQQRPPMAPLPIGRRSAPPPPIAGSNQRDGTNPWNAVDAYDDYMQSSFPGIRRAWYF